MALLLLRFNWRILPSLFMNCNFTNLRETVFSSFVSGHSLKTVRGSSCSLNRIPLPPPLSFVLWISPWNTQGNYLVTSVLPPPHPPLRIFALFLSHPTQLSCGISSRPEPLTTQRTPIYFSCIGYGGLPTGIFCLLKFITGTMMLTTRGGEGVEVGGGGGETDSTSISPDYVWKETESGIFFFFF